LEFVEKTRFRSPRGEKSEKWQGQITSGKKKKKPAKSTKNSPITGVQEYQREFVLKFSESIKETFIV